MQRYAETRAGRGKARCRYDRRRQRSRPRDNRPANGTYRDRVAASSDVNRARFSRFIAWALTSARTRGMTDRDIVEATGVAASTFHRWQRADFKEAPEIERVRRFCEGLGVPVAGALVALGVTEGRDQAEPEPAIPPDVQRILRALADPHVPTDEKLIIREMLRMIAARIRGYGRSSPSPAESPNRSADPH